MADKENTSLKLVLGEEILERPLLVGADSINLKHTTYDLTIGDIFPVGKEGYKERKAGKIDRYAIGPREAVWILSQEEFQLPSTITGMATLRTSFTKQGLVAFNVGIIDPLYNGPISTVLLNFSRRSVDLEVGEKFFRVLFFEHSSVEPASPTGESINRADYVKELTNKALNDYSKNFLDIPEFDNAFYAEAVWKLAIGFIKQHWVISLLLAIAVVSPLIYVWSLPDYREWFVIMKNAGSALWENISALFKTPSNP